MNTPWTIQLFGELCACRDTERITRFPTHKMAALLAYLAYHPDQAHSREALIELLWPECDLIAGRNRLNNLLSGLRHLLEPVGTPSKTILETDHSHVRLVSEQLSTDVIEFERLLGLAAQAEEGTERIGLLEEALALYQNGLLPGFKESWVLPERVRLRERYVEALQELAWNLQQTGELEPALKMLSKVLEVDPYREAAYRSQMRLYAALGQPAAAQQSYTRLECVFREDLGVVPSAATRELAELLRRDPRAVVGEHERKVVSPSARTSPTSSSRSVMETVDTSPQPAQSTTSPRTNLPVALTRFFGREEQTQRLQEWLTQGDMRLITLTGPGGSGKTRLAVETALRAVSAFAGRVWFVDLASLQDGRLLPFALAHTLQVTLSPQSDPLEQVVGKLQKGPSLLVLDNFEHLLRLGSEPSKSEREVGEESALLVRLLLERVAELKCLVTSRQPLHLGGEQELSVPTLAVPSHSDTPEHLLGYAGVALYMDRAKAVKPEFALTEQNAEAVVVLCRKLEGMPLAIEMAAAWVKTLHPAKILERLEHQLDLLVSRRRDLPARQQSLRATFEWSYDLLEPELQECFGRLSVFRGGFSVEALEALCGSGALGMLLELQERSLVLSEEVGEVVRYRLLESLREFAFEKLEASGELEETQRRHAEYCLVLAEEIESQLRGPEQGAWLERLETEYDNMRAALEWYRGGEGRAEIGLRLTGALRWFWIVRGYMSEGRTYLMDFLALAKKAPSEFRVKAISGVGSLAMAQNDNSTAKSFYEEALAIYRETGERGLAAATLGCLGGIAYNLGDYKTSQAYHEESLTIHREMGDKIGIAVSLDNLGTNAYGRNDHATARIYFEESLALRREMQDDLGVGNALDGLAHVAQLQGDYEAAEALYQECLSLYRVLGFKVGVGSALHSLGNISYWRGDFDQAASLYEQSLTVYREVGRRAGEAHALFGLGCTAVRQGSLALAESYHDQALAISRELGHREVEGQILSSMGYLAKDQGDFAEARSLFKESLKIACEVDDRRSIAIVLEGMASLAILDMQGERAARLFGAAQFLRDAIDAQLPPSDRAPYDRDVAALRAMLGEEACTTAWEAGRQMTLDQAIEEVLALPPA